jgi:hypothetical protein
MMHDAHVIHTYTPAPTTYYTHVCTPVTHLQPPVIYTYTHTHIYQCNPLVQRCTDTRPRPRTTHTQKHQLHTHTNGTHNKHTHNTLVQPHTHFFEKDNGNLWSAFLLAPVLRPWAKLKNRTYLPRCQEKAFVGRLEAWNHELKTNEQNWLHYLFSNQLRHSVH